MTENNGRFVQIHALVSYPPSNLNRDDMGRPKTAVMGGKPRLRISSQSMKRAWRESEFFSDALSGHVGFRTKRLGEYVYDALKNGFSLSSVFAKSPVQVNPVMDEKSAEEWTKQVVSVFAKLDTKTKFRVEQLVHVSHDEISQMDAFLSKIAQEGLKAKETEDLNSLMLKPVTDVDIALFGRMIAASPKDGVDAAAQVAHPITIHPVVVEDDYFTAVDDLNTHEEDAGAAHLGINEYGAGVFYTYVCVNRELLIENLGGDVELANRAIGALVECVAKVGPKGKQNSYASRAYASYLMVEQGSQQPRSLAAAFLGPMSGNNYLSDGISRLEMEYQALDTAYGPCADARCVLNVPKGEGTLQDVLKFVSGKDA